MIVIKGYHVLEKIKYIYRAYRFRYKIDPDEIKFVRTHLKKGDIAVDIGSHKGGYLYWLHKSVGKEGKIYAFEPQKKLFNYLLEIAKISKYTNVVIENKGLSSKEDTLNFYIPVTKSGTSPGARIDTPITSEQYEKLEIDVVRLDNYFLNNQIFPKLIKIDVEGHEKAVLTGGTNLLKKCKPFILMECENRHLSDQNIFDVFKLLTDIGYKGYFNVNNKTRPLSEFDLDTHQKMGTGKFWEEKGYINNFIFQPRL